MGEITVPDTADPSKAHVTFLDEHGHETTADDVPQWSSSDEAVATVTADDDGLGAMITYLAPGVTLIDVSSTNEDGSTAQAQGTVTVQPGDAVMGSVEFEQPSTAETPSEPSA